MNEDDYRAEFDKFGLDADRYYDAWRILLALWYSIWWCSNTDWTQYQRTIWQRFADWVTSAARRSNDLQRFFSIFARQATLRYVGKNKNEREYMLQLLALPNSKQRRIVQQFRDDMPILIAFVRQYSAEQKELRKEITDDKA